MSPPVLRRTTERGATMAEYALLLVCVLVLAGGAFKLLGDKVGQRTVDARAAF